MNHQRTNQHLLQR